MKNIKLLLVLSALVTISSCAVTQNSNSDNENSSTTSTSDVVESSSIQSVTPTEEPSDESEPETPSEPSVSEPEVPSEPSESEPEEEYEVESVDILKDDVSIDSLDVFVKDTFTLKGLVNDSLDVDLTWTTSNSDVATIDDLGNVEVLDKGKCIVSVYVTDYPYITDSIYIDATRKVEQLGVGSGKSKDDPIFLGNEGEDEPIEVYFIEMQHIYSDSIFIKKGNVEVLIDAGYEYDGTFVNKVITEHCTDNRLDLFMVSHSDGDHIDGIKKALSTVDNISLMVDFGGTVSGNVAYARNTYKEKGMAYYSAYDSVNKLNGAVDRYYLTSEFYFDVLNTGNYITLDRTSAGNGNSLAVIFHYKDFSFFSGGDLTASSEADLIKNEDLPEVTLYKAAHHGSHGSNTQELLDIINPKAIAISAARANNYSATPGAPKPGNTYNLNAASGHPAAAAIERFYKAPNISRNLNVYWNAVNGTMKFTSYGEDDFTFEGSETMKGYYDLTLTDNVAVWNEEIQNFENKVTGEENYRLHETKVFQFRDYIQYLPQWAKDEYFPNYTA